MVSQAPPPDPGVSEHARLDVDPFDLLVAKRRVDGLYAALAKLNERDADVVRRRAGLGRPPQTLKQVGEELGLTSERVRQVQLRAWARLKALMTPSLPNPPKPPRPKYQPIPDHLLKAPAPPKKPPGPKPRYSYPRRRAGTQRLPLDHYYLDRLHGLIADRKRREIRVRVCKALRQPTNPIKSYVLAVFRACHAEGLTTLDGDELHDFFRWRDNGLPFLDLARVVEKLVRTGKLYADLDYDVGSLHQWFGAADFALWREPLRR